MSKYTQGVKTVEKKNIKKTRTRKAIIKAFQQLMMTTSFDKIRIQNITDLAEVNRHSFYNHFNDKYDLLYQTVYQMFVIDPTLIEGKSLLEQSIIQIPLILQYIEDNRMFFKSAFKDYKHESFQNFFQKMIYEWIAVMQSRMVENTDIIDHDGFYIIEFKFYIAGYSHLLINWLYNEPDKPAHILANEFIALLR
jgi:AcrR family transcriptional regulator